MAKEDDVNPQDLADYTAAFNEEAGASQADGDDGFGLMPGEEPDGAEEGVADTTSQDAGEGAPATIVVAVVEGEGDAATEAAGNAEAQAQAKAVTDEANTAACDSGTPATSGEQEAAAQSGEPAKDKTAVNVDDDSDVPEADKQAFKSWRGRLKAEEERLKRERAEIEAARKGAPKAADAEPAGETATPESDALEQGAQQASAEGKPEMAQAMKDAAEQVESGAITAEEARARLAEDFGEEFTTLLRAAVGSAAPANAASKEDVESLRSELQRRHFEEIQDAHPDFVDVHKSPEFAAYLKANPAAAQIAERGSSRQINKMLTEYKKTREPAKDDPPAQEQVDPAAADAAGAVRSRGVRLPERPGKAEDQDFEAAFNSF